MSSSPRRAASTIAVRTVGNQARRTCRAGRWVRVTSRTRSAVPSAGMPAPAWDNLPASRITSTPSAADASARAGASSGQYRVMVAACSGWANPASSRALPPGRSINSSGRVAGRVPLRAATAASRMP